MFKWLKKIFFGNPEPVVASEPEQIEICNEVFQSEAIAMSEAPHVAAASEEPKPKKKRYYKPKPKQPKAESAGKETKPKAAKPRKPKPDQPQKPAKQEPANREPAPARRERLR